MQVLDSDKVNFSKDSADFDKQPLRPYNASLDNFLVNFSSIGIQSIGIQSTGIQSHPLNNGQAQLTHTPQLANYPLSVARHDKCSLSFLWLSQIIALLE